MKDIIINGRYLTQNLTGVQRFGFEITRALSMLQQGILVLKPNVEVNLQYSAEQLAVKSIGQRQSHFWEQLDLPAYLKKNHNPLLLNFCSTAPISYTNQVVTIHDLAYLHKAWHSWKFRAFYTALLPRIAKNSKHILTVSEFSKQELISTYKLPEDKITVIYNGIFKSDQKPSDNFIAKYIGKKFILCVGSIDPRKNLKSLIKGFIKTRVPDSGIKLYLIGKFNKNFNKDPELFSLINQHRNIEFLGYCTDAELNWFYQNALLFVYPSCYEGFGLPPVEAMSNGCPVITSNVTSLPEVCGNAAVYCDPRSVNDIAAKIELVLTDALLADTMRAKGVSQASKYSWAASAQKLNALLQQIQ